MSGSIDESVSTWNRWELADPVRGSTLENLLLRKDRDRLAQRRWVHKCVHMN